MKSIRVVLKELIIGKQIQGSIGDFETQKEKQRIDLALTSIAKTIEKEKKEIITGNYATDITPFLQDNTEKEIWNACCDHIVKMIQ